MGNTYYVTFKALCDFYTKTYIKPKVVRTCACLCMHLFYKGRYYKTMCTKTALKLCFLNLPVCLKSLLTKLA